MGAAGACSLLSKTPRPLLPTRRTCDDVVVLPLTALPKSVASLRGLLFDVDDTVLDHGRLSVESLAALYQLAHAGLTLVGVTGRPASWGQVLARQWPVAGMVTENGAIAVVKRGNRVELLDRLDPVERSRRRQRLVTLAREISRRFPALEPSDDTMGRVADYSFDVAESRRVEPRVVQAAAALARERGARVVRSSIQLHISLDGDDKATGALHFLRTVCGVEPRSALDRFAFVGDSENDAPGFAAFRHSFAVANLSGRLSLLPRFIASRPMGEGFREIASALLEARQACDGRAQPSRS